MEGKSFKVLVCDDSILIRKKLKDCLLDCGCNEVFEAIDGQDAVDSYKQHQPDLVFMDIVMPIKNGIEAVQDIIEFNKNARIVMLSSSGTNAQLVKAVQAGAYEFIQKPFEKGLIEKVISALRMGV